MMITQRKTNNEAGTLTGRIGGHLNGAMMERDKRMGQIKTNAGASAINIIATHLIKTVKDMLTFRLWNTYSRIRDCHDKYSVWHLFCTDSLLQKHLNTTSLWRIFQRI